MGRRHPRHRSRPGHDHRAGRRLHAPAHAPSERPPKTNQGDPVPSSRTIKSASGARREELHRTGCRAGCRALRDCGHRETICMSRSWQCFPEVFAIAAEAGIEHGDLDALTEYAGRMPAIDAQCSEMANTLPSGKGLGSHRFPNRALLPRLQTPGAHGSARGISWPTGAVTGKQKREPPSRRMAQCTTD